MSTHEDVWRLMLNHYAAEQRGADRMARAMIAALYWRAGELAVLAEGPVTATRAQLYLHQFHALLRTARVMERAL